MEILKIDVKKEPLSNTSGGSRRERISASYRKAVLSEIKEAMSGVDWATITPVQLSELVRNYMNVRKHYLYEPVWSVAKRMKIKPGYLTYIKKADISNVQAFIKIKNYFMKTYKC